jgi:RNA polymerase sigma-70 factor (ECF subfamily)
MSAEKQLISLAQKGDKDAFGSLVEANMKRVYVLSFQMMHNHSDADEIAQLTFVKAFGSIGGFHGDSSLSTWLYRITINLCLEQLRKRNRNISLSSTGPDDENDEMEFPIHLPSDQNLLEQETSQVVWKALGKLKPEIRAAVVLVYLQDLTPREASRQMEVAESTVHWRLFKARNLLKKDLDLQRNLELQPSHIRESR